MPRNPQDLSQEDADAMELGGFPADGDEFDENAVVDDPVDDDGQGNQPDPASDPAALLAEVQAQLRQTQQELADMRTRVAPQTVQPQAPAPEEIDWEKALFEDPKGAVSKIIETTKKAVRAEYVQDQGRREFWNRFYAKHPDLEDSHELVQMVLNANMATLGNKSIPDAIRDLSALTRQKIASYIQGQGKNTRRTNRAQAEGGGPAPQQRTAPRPENSEPQTLGSLIRKRRAAKAA